MHFKPLALCLLAAFLLAPGLAQADTPEGRKMATAKFNMTNIQVNPDPWMSNTIEAASATIKRGKRNRILTAEGTMTSYFNASQINPPGKLGSGFYMTVNGIWMEGRRPAENCEELTTCAMSGQLFLDLDEYPELIGEPLEVVFHAYGNGAKILVEGSMIVRLEKK